MALHKVRCCSLKLEGDLKDRDHGYFVRLLLRSGVLPTDIKQIDLKGSRGFCKVTLSTPEALERLIAQEVVVNGTPVPLFVGDGTVTSLHIFGVDEDVSLLAISESLAEFGSIIGQPTRETKEVATAFAHLAFWAGSNLF